MIRSLRKRHLQIWIAWGVFIPMGIIGAVIVRPKLPKEKLLQPTSIAALPVVLKTVNRDGYTISIRGNADTSRLQLEWISKKALIYPTATVYSDTANTNNISSAELIGRIEAGQTYRFELKKELQNDYHFMLYDFIHNQIIDSIAF